MKQARSPATRSTLCNSTARFSWQDQIQVAEKTKFAVDNGFSTLTCIGSSAHRKESKVCDNEDSVIADSMLIAFG